MGSSSAEPHGADATAVMPSSPPVAAMGMRRQEGTQVRGHADRADAGTAAAVRHGEGLVEVEVADVGADVARIGEAHLRVHVGAVHIDLSAGVVYGVDDLADAAPKTPCVEG